MSPAEALSKSMRPLLPICAVNPAAWALAVVARSSATFVYVVSSTKISRKCLQAWEQRKGAASVTIPLQS